MKPCAAAGLALLACVGAHAGSLTVRDADTAWIVTDDPQADANDFLLRHLVDGTRPDERFGRGGQTTFTLGAGNDPPASVRVDTARRVWMVGASLAGNQPQPVIARFLAEGATDLRWGVQGKVQLTPSGVTVKPNDLLPLADGSVLVAGEAAGLATPRAVVFHLNADGSLDRRFGSDGVWRRPGDDASTATSLAASTDGLAAVAIAVRGARPGAELWAVTDAGPGVLQRKPADDSSDGEDLRVEWQADHWALVDGGGPTVIVPAALLGNRPSAAPVASAASDPGGGGFSPFIAEGASAPAATPQDEGLPWTWMALAAIALAGGAGLIARRARKAHTGLREPPRR